MELAKDNREKRDAAVADDSRNRRSRSQRSEFGVHVTGLPRSCSWQDLKDFARKSGSVVFTEVMGRGEGLIEFSSAEERDNAIARLDGSEFSNKFDTAVVKVTASTARHRSRSRS